MQERIKKWLSGFLLSSIFLSVLFVLTGGTLYLLQQGQDLVSYQHFFQPSLNYSHFTFLIHNIFKLDPFALILVGFLILVFSQIIRVLLLGFFFLQTAEYLLALASFFIFIILMYSTLWPH